MNFSMTNSHIFSKSLSINSMHSTFWHGYFRTTEYRGFVHVNPHAKKMSGALELIVGVEGTPELGSRLTEIIYPYTLSRPTLAVVRKASSLSILNKNLDTRYFSPIMEHKCLLQGSCLASHKIKIVVRDVRVSDRHEMSLRLFNLSDHFL